jgi:very-short-patch-repair endonuclease
VQHGIVSRRQLLDAGFTPRAIDHGVTAHRFHVIHPGVYVVGHEVLPPGAHHMAAVLAVGDGAVLSCRSAGSRLGQCPTPSGPIDVTVLRQGGRRHKGIAVHVTRSLPDSDITKVEGIPCTSWARTLVDLAGILNERQLGYALERTIELRMFDRDTMDAALNRSRGKRGVGRLKALLTHLSDEPAPTRFELERRFLQLVKEARLPYPVVNGYVGGLEVDFHWPEHHVAVETDGRATHGHTIAFHRDRDRDLTLLLADWHVIRLTWRQVVNEPERIVRALRKRLQPR